MSALSGRIRAFDWLRGLAILFMIQCHALTLLRPELREGPLFRHLQWLDGLVAPAFIFTSGFSLALVQARAALTPGANGRWIRVRKTLRRMGEVFAAATLVNWMWFPIFREPVWMIRIDILHCIGLSLLLAVPIVVGLAQRPTALSVVSLSVALTLFFFSPFAEQVAGPLARLLNKTHSNTTFPLTPWTGYAFLGVCVGAVAAKANVRALYLWLTGLTFAGFVLWRLQPVLFNDVYPPHHPFATNPSDAGHRWMWVLLIVLVLLTVELRPVFRKRVDAATAPSPVFSFPVRFVEVFGASSLAAYVIHLAILFYRFFGLGFSFNAWWGGSCGWPKYFGLTAVVIVLTFLVCLVVDPLYRRWDDWLRGRPS